MQSKAPTVAAYLAERDPKTRAALTKVRALLRAHLPDADESMAFGMPSYGLGDVPVAAFAAQKSHLCLYLCCTTVVAKHRAAFKGLSMGKSCIRFQAIEQLPMAAVKRILAESNALAARVNKEPRAAAAS